MFKDLLYETKGFKYQVTVNVLLKKKNGDIEFAPVFLILLVKQWLILNMIMTNLPKKVYAGSVIVLIKDLVG